MLEIILLAFNPFDKSSSFFDHFLAFWYNKSPMFAYYFLWSSSRISHFSFFLQWMPLLLSDWFHILGLSLLWTPLHSQRFFISIALHSFMSFHIVSIFLHPENLLLTLLIGQIWWCSSWNIFSLFSFFNDIFARYRIHGWQFFFLALYRCWSIVFWLALFLVRSHW